MGIEFYVCVVTVVNNYPGDAETGPRHEASVTVIIELAAGESEAIEKAIAEVKGRNPKASNTDAQIDCTALRVELNELKRAITIIENGRIGDDDDSILEATLIE